MVELFFCKTIMITPANVSFQRRAVYFWIIPAVIILWYLVFGIGVYGFQWQGNTVQRVLRYTPLPVGIVNWHVLSYRSFIEQRLGAEQSKTYLGGTTQGVYQGANDTTQLTLNTMIRAAVTEQLAKRLGVTVSDQDVDQAYQAQLLQTGNAEQVKIMVYKLYHWTTGQFQTYVIRPDVLRDKLQEKLSFDDTYSKAAATQATNVLNIVTTSSESFGDLAKKYSDDAYGANGGDLGFVTAGELTKEIDDAAFSLEVNTVSQIIHTKYGFHIIKPIEKKTVDGVEQVHLLQITVLAPQVDDMINTELKTKRMLLFLPRYTWSSETHSVNQK